MPEELDEHSLSREAKFYSEKCHINKPMDEKFYKRTSEVLQRHISLKSTQPLLISRKNYKDSSSASQRTAPYIIHEMLRTSS